ncbi:hypothetical protein AB8O64_04900 [Streptomyces sp. QH1-20]|uniref:hypothetical protein n=1 Tax=Streptomyces sp. QH1-20 TaxID=3240934 RepID=UPI003512F3F2
MSELLLQPSRGVCWWAASTYVPLRQRLRWLAASINRHFCEADGLADSTAVRRLSTHFETISKTGRNPSVASLYRALAEAD